MMVDPGTVSWSDADDLEVMLAARAGVQQAITEARRRGLQL